MNPVIIDAEFPGGNILVDSVDGDVIRLRQDRRTTTEWWFYWNFRVRGAAGRTLRFEFGDGDVFAALGPCYSADGKQWQWLGRECVDGTSFTFTFPKGQKSAFFSFCIPYLESDLQQFLVAHPEIERRILAKSEQGRDIELLKLPSRTGALVVPVTARLHACESMGSFVMEGIAQGWQEPGCEFLRESVDLMLVPFFDKDGVEIGDQGKLRAPHDHNRDFIDAPIYASTRAYVELLASCRDRVALAFDLHCPWMRYGRNEEIFLVGSPHPWQTEQDRFSQVLERTQQGELRYCRANDIGCDVEWNQGSNPTSTRWTWMNSSAAFAAAIEFPYALAGGQAVTADGARAFGRDIARAVSVYLQEIK